MLGDDDLERWQAEDPESLAWYLEVLEAETEARVARIRWLWGGSPLASYPLATWREWADDELDRLSSDLQRVGPPCAPRPRYFPGRAKVAA
jgi:hypothetical protein